MAMTTTSRNSNSTKTRNMSRKTGATAMAGWIPNKALSKLFKKTAYLNESTGRLRVGRTIVASGIVSAALEALNGVKMSKAH